MMMRVYTRIKWPSLQAQREADSRIEELFPLVGGRFGFIDGKNLNVLQVENVEKQNSLYNGWLHGCFVTGVGV